MTKLDSEIICVNAYEISTKMIGFMGWKKNQEFWQKKLRKFELIQLTGRDW